MAHAISPTQRIEWMYKLNANSSHPAEWRIYSDIEIAIIEEQYQNKQPEARLDDYHIDLINQVQISIHNSKHQCPVKRVVNLRGDGRLREERFMPNPILPSQPFTDARHRSSFLDAAGQYFNLTIGYDLTVLAMLVEKAAEGIIVEARKVGKEKEGQWMAAQLLKVKSGRYKDVAECCARLYCMESFLYKTLNEIMRLGMDEQHQALWRSKLPTLGPFTCLLFNLQQNLSLPTAAKTMTVYRGANFSQDLIEQYRRISALPEANRGSCQFTAFTSTSRNREKAQQFGNVLFVIEISEADGCDVSSYSEFNEEEHLLNPHFYFFIQSCIFDDQINKWIIKLRSLNI
ncbi:unnamed protein product [Rotaria magnacalcarata]|uniref:NAD(P)(+)--arginine ADP-ribosyltransferase n=1 Tax=Rotaria magnacalcarata TaxID=392030 RepID=A0A820CKC8_9BILA|nr:unnamed protein product [Rotaria magnacalcarata]CAF2096687.1 unnamed protein product [Rotaria magnacalcarata]CAF4223215.1 unnamed protein product [Rotaria magnacalcarata]CAF4252283.1 unnamed protein product [Rotaria magnacalcarata]